MRWVSVVVLILLVAIELVVTIAMTWTHLSSSGRVIEASAIRSDSTLLVLGSLVHDGEPGDYVRGRLDTAVALFATGRVDRIIDSGNGSAAAGDEPAVMRDYLEARGVSPQVIADDPHGIDTDTSCRRAHDVYAVRRVVIVTQDFHLPRAIALCRRRGIDAVGVAAECDCPTWTVVRNHLRELLLAGPNALLTAVGPG